MNKIWKAIIFTSLLFTTACNLPLVSAVEPPTPTAGPTEIPTPAATPTTAPLAATLTPNIAPLCDPNAVAVQPPSQCQAPAATESTTFCTDKKPYNLILVNPGLTYEVLTKGFRCSNAGVKGDKQMVTCTGPMSLPYEISFCDPACVIPTAQSKVTQCQQGYNYNSVQGCCTQELQQINQNCMTLKFKTGSCVANCSGIIQKSMCKKNSFACEWSEQDKACQSRK